MFAPSAAMQLYGWDASSANWHGPTDVSATSAVSQRLLDNLRSAPARCWYGPLSCGGAGAGEPKARFFIMIHALRDCGVAMVYCDETKAGPAEIIVVVPPEQRSRMREDFAFEFVAFAGFLGALGEGADLPVHDGIAAALAETHESDALVFTISTGVCGCEPDLALSRCVEKIAATMLQWLA